jgi:AcrR family transcriptional regulator
MGEVVGREIDPRYVAAARDLAERSGTAAFTVQQVVAAAGGSLKGFYRGFAGKDDLLCAVLAEDCTDGAAILSTMVREHRGTEARVRGWVEGLFTLMTMGEEGYVAVLVREHHRLSETRPTDLDAAIEPLVAILVDELEAGGDVDPRATATWMFRLVLSAIHDVVTGVGDDRDALVARLWRFCWGGLDGVLR